MLSRRAAADELPHLNMTPMVDVVLCLLVFFMAATKLYDWDEEQFNVRVPEVAEAAPLTAAPRDLTVSVLGPGRAEMADKEYDLPALTDALRSARARYEDQGVLVRGDARRSYQDVADVLAACEAAGIRNVRLPVRPAPPPRSPPPREWPRPLLPGSHRMDRLRALLQTIRDLARPEYLNALAGSTGGWMYAILFAIVFAETGLVVTPFLPGDSLLFAVGALAAGENSPINLPLTAALLIVAAVLGDAVNYAIGKRLGPKVFSREDSRLLNKAHLLEAQRFYDKYGGKTIILARFVPIVRTFAPFVAGIGRMSYWRFAVFNVVGGAAWVLICLLAGRLFGGHPFVKKNFELVALAIVAISLLPIAVEFLRARLHKAPPPPVPALSPGEPEA